MNKSISRFNILALPDLVFSIYLIAIFFLREDVSSRFFSASLLIIGVYSMARTIMVIVAHGKFNDRIRYINGIISEFKKGKFIIPDNKPHGSDDFIDIIKDLSVIGKHFDSIISSQMSEIENLRELYNNIVLSISSYFIVLNDSEEIIFANESFCKKFMLELDGIIGKYMEDIFQLFTAVVKDSIHQVISAGDSTVIEKTHLISKNNISIIADIKISKLVVRGDSQIIIVIDDVTSKCRKDFQMNLLSQVSESIQRDDQIDRILHMVLTGVTSGSGLGFNRAMLFLLDEKTNTLEGKIAVGPDKMDEAIEVWNSVTTFGDDIIKQIKHYDEKNEKGKHLIESVKNTKISADGANILAISMMKQENIHVYDSQNDTRLDEETRKLMDVREFVVAPLISVNRSIGVIVADNKFNQTPISSDSIELLSMFCFQAALAIESYNNLHMIKKEMLKIKARQEAMVESEKLAAVGRIAMHIAHEIRNPLVTMGGYARRILQLNKDFSKNSDQIIKAANVVLKESERLEKTLSNVMDFTKSATFIMEFHNVNDIIIDTYELLKNLFQDKKIVFTLELGEDLPMIKCDFNQLKQMLLNLLQNALDSTPPEGKIEILSKLESGNVIVFVRDTGSGILDDDINKVFEPFYTTKATGVGLGLSIVKKIILDHSGEISVRNRKSGGVEFKVSFPLPA
jgi:signal transduction histidine kinase